MGVFFSMTSLMKILRFGYRQIKKLIVKCIAFLPVTSKYIGSPKGYYISSKEYCKTCEMDSLNNVTHKTYLPSSVSKRNPPTSICKETHWKFNGRYLHENPETFVLSITNGRVFSGNGTIITHNDWLILDVSLQFGIGTDAKRAKSHNVFKYLKLPKCQETPQTIAVAKRAKSHNVFKYLKLPKCQETSQTIAVLATSGGEGYFHWLTDALPRFEIISKTLGIDSIDKYVVNKGVPIIEETLVQDG